MAEPARKLDDQDAGNQLSAMERARQSWGMSTNTDQTSDTQPQSDDAASDEQSALDRARDRWGDASVHDGGKSGTEQSGSDNPQDDDKSSGKRDLSSDKDTQQSNEQSSHGDQSQIPFRKEDKPLRTRLRGRVDAKTSMIIAGASAGIIGVVFAFFAALPPMLLHTIRSLYMDKMGDLQTRQHIRYRRNKFSHMTDAFTRDGRLGGPILQDMERRGYRFDAGDPANPRRVTAMYPPGSSTPLTGVDMAAHIETDLTTRRPILTKSNGRWKTKRVQALYNRYGIDTGKSVVRASSADLDDAAHTVRKNMANSVYGSGGTGSDAIDINTRELAPDANQADINAANQFNNAIATNDDMLKEAGEFGEIVQELKTKGHPDDLSPELKQLAQIADEINVPVTQGPYNYVDNLARSTSSAWRRFKGVFSTTDILDKVCIIKGRLAKAVSAGRTLRALAYARMLADIVKVGDDITMNRANPRLLSEFGKKLTMLDSHGNPVGASPTMSWILSGKFSKSRNDIYKSGHGVDGKTTGIYRTLQEKTDIQGCSVFQNPVFQIGAEVGILVGSFFTGGGAKAMTAGAQVTLRQGLNQSIRQAFGGVFKREVAKRIGKDLVKTGAIVLTIELSFEAIMNVAQMYAQKSVGFNVTTFEQGAEFFGQGGAGKGKMDEKLALSQGMVPVTPEQYEPILARYNAEMYLEKRQQSLYAKIFDLNNTSSLATTALIYMPHSLGQLTSSIQSWMGGLGGSLVGMPGALLSTTSTLVSGVSYADTDPDMIAYDTYELEGGSHEGKKLVTDPHGNLIAVMRSDIEAIDPTENISWLSSNKDSDGKTYINPETREPVSKVYTKHIENCVDDIDTLSQIEKGSADKPEEDCLAELEVTKRLKAHLAFLSAEDSFDAEINPQDIAPVTGGGGGGMIDCSGAVGNAKIVCAAQNFMDVRYANYWSSTDWPGIWGTPRIRGSIGQEPEQWINERIAGGDNDFLECSGYVKVAIFSAFGVVSNAYSSQAFIRDTKNFEVLVSESDYSAGNFGSMLPGDILVRRDRGSGSGHIGMYVETLPDGKFSTLETSGGANVKGEKKSGYFEVKPDSYDYVLRYIGEGSSL